jgi:hypothetical protein
MIKFLIYLKLFVGILLITFIAAVTFLVVEKMSNLKDELVKKDEQRMEMIKKVQAECVVVHKTINSNNVDVTYRCDDGIEYSFVEWF